MILKSQVQLRSYFCSQKKTGHTTVKQMRRHIVFSLLFFCHRCFLAGVSVPLPPTNSRIVEAICIILINKNVQSERTSGSGIVIDNSILLTF